MFVPKFARAPQDARIAHGAAEGSEGPALARARASLGVPKGTLAEGPERGAVGGQRSTRRVVALFDDFSKK